MFMSTLDFLLTLDNGSDITSLLDAKDDKRKRQDS